MPKRGRGSKPTKGLGNIGKFENNYHIRPPFVGRKSKQSEIHHAGIFHLDLGNSSPGVTQPTKGNKETIRTHSQPSQLLESSSIRGTKMVYHEDHAEGTGENQVNE